MTLAENLEHLAALLDTDEQKEFMDTISDQIGDAETEIEDLKEERNELKEEKELWQDTLSELEEERRYTNHHDLGIGDIEWRTGSFELGELFDLVCEKVKATSHIKVMSLLNAL
jgi:hypothetical protein